MEKHGIYARNISRKASGKDTFLTNKLGRVVCHNMALVFVSVLNYWRGFGSAEEFTAILLGF